MAQCISLQNTQGSIGFLEDDAVASLLDGGGLPFLLVLLGCFVCGVGLLLIPSWEAVGVVAGVIFAGCGEFWAGFGVVALRRLSRSAASTCSSINFNT